MACQQQPATQATSSTAEVGTKMLALINDRKYDDAITMGLQAITGQPRDAIIYRWIAIAYTGHASNDAAHSKKWLESAANYADKSIDAAPADELNRHSIAHIWEWMGDFDPEKRCGDYAKSMSILKETSEHLRSDTFQIGDKTAPAAPLKKDIESNISKLATKETNAKCN